MFFNCLNKGIVMPLFFGFLGSGLAPFNNAPFFPDD